MRRKTVLFEHTRDTFTPTAESGQFRPLRLGGGEGGLTIFCKIPIGGRQVGWACDGHFKFVARNVILTKMMTLFINLLGYGLVPNVVSTTRATVYSSLCLLNGVRPSIGPMMITFRRRNPVPGSLQITVAHDGIKLPPCNNPNFITTGTSTIPSSVNSTAYLFPHCWHGAHQETGDQDQICFIIILQW